MSQTENYQITFPLETGLYAHNSSISKENGNYVVYSRITNFSNCSLFDRVKTLNDKRINIIGISEFNKEFNIISQRILHINHSLEDLRVFFWNNKKYFIGSEYDIDNLNIFCPILLDQNFNKINIVNKDGKKFINNKNFSPIIVNHKLFFIKNHNPLEILKIDKMDNESIVLSDYVKNIKNPQLPMLRGSTPYINIGNNRLLAITHDLVLNDFCGWSISFNKTYRHYFTIINFEDIYKPFIENVSKPICLLGNCGIEFVMGFIESYDGQSYIITLGKNDCTSHIVKISKKEIFKYF